MRVEILRRWLLVLVAAMALVAAGCDGGGGGGGGGLGPGGGEQDAGDGGGGDDDSDADDDAAAGGDIGDGCELVTEADAEAILGEPVTKADDSQSSSFTASACSWEVENETSFKLLQFSAFEGAQFYGGELFKDDPNFEKVDGVGDDAFFVEPLGVQLQVIDGDTVLLIDVSGFNTDPPLDKEKVREQLVDLAKKVLARV